MKTAAQPTRVFYFDYLRIFAALAVMILHVAAQGFYVTPAQSADWQTLNIFDSLTRWGVPIFIMISGALFLGKEQKISKVFKKNISRLFIAFVFWALAYTLYYKFVTQEITTKTDILFNLAKGCGHLWFLPMIMGLYMISPILRKIVEDRKMAWYFVILSIIFSFLIPQIAGVLNYKFNIANDLLNAATHKFGFGFVLGYSSYFVLGHLLHTAKIKQRLKKYIYILGVAGAVLTVAATSFITIKIGEPTIIFYRNLSINVLLMSAALFIFCKDHFDKPIKNQKIQKFTLFLSQCSFGAYLVHIFALNILAFFFHIDSVTFGPAIVSIPTLSVCIFVVSFAVSAILNKIPVINKYIV